MHPTYRCPKCNTELIFHQDNTWRCSYCNIILPVTPIYPQHYPPYYPPYQQPYQRDPEVQALLPSRYDAMFYTGVFLFIVLVFVLLASRGNPVVYILMVISNAIPIIAIFLDFKFSPRTKTGTLGNICALIWIILQIIATIIFGLFIISGVFIHN